MQDMDDDAKSVAKTERSLGGETSSSAAKPGSGLCKDGTVFLKVKTCIACGIKNTDTNEIQKGSFAENRYTVWHRGTSIDPSSKDCRVCHMTYQIGSFGEEGESIEAFCTKMRKSPQLQAEFDAARTKMLELLNEGQVRFKAKTLHNAKAKLEDCRKKVVEEFKEASEQIVTPYKMYERSLYEQMHPGAIERKGLKVAKKVINGELKEVVMIRKQREGEWDLNVVEKVGVKHKEEVATSDLKLHEGQLGNKFASSKKRVFSAVDKANDWQDAHAEDDKGGAGAEELPSRVEEESSEDDDFMTGSLLQDIGSPPKKSQRSSATAAVGSTAGNSKPGAGSSKPKATPAPPKATPAQPKASGLSAVSKVPEAGTTANPMQPTQNPATEKLAPEGRGRPSKFRNRTPTDVLEEHGLNDVKTLQQAVHLVCHI